MSEGVQMIQREPHSLPVVAEHRIDSADMARACVDADQRNRLLLVPHLLNSIVKEHGNRAVQKMFVQKIRGVFSDDDFVISAFPELRQKRRKHDSGIGPERGVRRDKHGDIPAVSKPAEFAGGADHPCANVRTHMFVIVEHARNGCGRNIRKFCNLPHSRHFSSSFHRGI